MSTETRVVMVVGDDRRLIDDARAATSGHRILVAGDLDAATRVAEGGEVDLVLLGPAFGEASTLAAAADHLRAADPLVEMILVTPTITNRLLQAALRCRLRDVLDLPLRSESLADLLEELPHRPTVDVVVESAGKVDDRAAGDPDAAEPNATFEAETASERRSAQMGGTTASVNSQWMTTADRAPRFVLTGGVGSGKSAAGDCFRALGVVVLDADEIARDVLAPGTPETDRVLERWPQVDEAGAIDRGRLAQIVFADPGELESLEKITHPATRAALERAIEAHGSGPLAVEMPIPRDWLDPWPKVVVDAPDDVRRARAVMRRPDHDEAIVDAIMARQPSRAEWLESADFVVDNSTDLKHLADECARVWELLRAV